MLSLPLWLTLLELPRRFPYLNDVCQTLITRCFGSLGDALTKALPPGKSFSDFLSGRNKIQQYLNRRQAALELDALIEEASTGRDIARLRSLKGKGAGAWISAIPTSTSLALNSSEYRLARSLRFGLPIFPDWAKTCNCGSNIDDSGYHLITCKLGRGPVWSHEPIAFLWSDCLRSLNVHHCREPHHRMYKNRG